jgi:DNA-binding HxlR family transcriptional regulator
VRSWRTCLDSEPAACFAPLDAGDGGHLGRERPEPENLYQLLGSRWVPDVLRELGAGTVRYNALHRRLGGVSHKMLTQTLRRLQRAELVHRRALGTMPPNVEYELTAAGLELRESLARLERWASTHRLLS